MRPRVGCTSVTHRVVADGALLVLMGSFGFEAITNLTKMQSRGGLF